MNNCLLCNSPDAQQILYFRNHIQCCDDLTEYICKKCDVYWSSGGFETLDKFWDIVKDIHQKDYHDSIDIL